ncbi:tissue factor pathway inhibitor-like isoform X2 [Branchiostoma floridae]|uniref:Tissue factor pathway inhibitor-like isoform X2 n=1 Tax=Branchiostoma floridae TaxID=7739 RepID=A0A9J7L8D5_BRAFL|nr:tissue factor pathway inhibitor-like isoform X2 [Branchiostoma floridae]
METVKIVGVFFALLSFYSVESLQPDGKHVCSRVRTTETGLEGELVCCRGYVATLVDDKEKCVRDDSSRVVACDLAADAGPCEGSHRRWYYDTSSGECHQFAYGGCGGNSNRFHSRKRCHATCGGKAQSARRIVTDVGANDDVCLEPMKVGICKAAVQRFFFNSEEKKCMSFTYGGCRGNGNNFVTMQECEATCASAAEVKPSDVNAPVLESRLRNAMDTAVKGTLKPYQPARTRPPVPVTGDVCLMSAQKGPCKAMKNRYFFNPTLGRCDQFVYGGCKGNRNNFLTMADCHSVCEDHIHATCSMPVEKGNCQSSFQRYFYDPTTSKCDVFTFTGCGGNKNNFMSLYDCQSACMFETIDRTRMNLFRQNQIDQKDDPALPGRKVGWWPAILVAGLVLVAAVIVGAVLWRRKARAATLNRTPKGVRLEDMTGAGPDVTLTNEEKTKTTMA